MFDNQYLQGAGYIGLAIHQTLNLQDFQAAFGSVGKALALFRAEEGLAKLLQTTREAAQTPEIKAAMAPPAKPK